MGAGIDFRVRGARAPGGRGIGGARREARRTDGPLRWDSRLLRRRSQDAERTDRTDRVHARTEPLDLHAFTGASVRPIVVTHAASPLSSRTELGKIADILIAGESTVDFAVALSALANPDKSATVNATLQVTSVEQLSRVLAKLEGVRDVFSVHRDGR